MLGRLLKAHIVVVAGACLAVGCSSPAPVEQQKPAQPAVETASASVRSPVSINAEMVTIVDHAGHQLWDAERAGRAPKTDRDWANLEEHATQIAAAGALVAVPGAGVRDAAWVSSPGWQKWARSLSDAGLAAVKASQSRNLEQLVAANGQLVDACEGCHKEFKPELPSEGIVHAHEHPFRAATTATTK